METTNHGCYVSFEVAKLLKQAGFDWKVDFFYQDGIFRSVLPDVLFDADGDFEDIEYYYKHIGAPHRSLDYNDGSSKFLEEYSAPTLSVAQRWLREMTTWQVEAICVYKEHKKLYSYCVFRDEYKDQILEEDFKTYEEALEAGIKKCLTLILEKYES